MLLKRLKWIFDFYLYGNFHVALCAVALVDISRMLFQYPPMIGLKTFIGCGTFFLYNLQRLFAIRKLGDVEQHTSSRETWLKKNYKLLFVLTFLSAIVGSLQLFYFEFPLPFVYALLIPIVVSLGYALPVIPWKPKWKRLRDVPGIKIFLIGIVWVWVTFIIPLWLSQYEEHMTKQYLIWNNLWWAFCLCLFFIAITIPFDIRDLSSDGGKIKSLPDLLGVKGAKIFAIVLLLIANVVLFYYRPTDWPEERNFRPALIFFPFCTIVSAFVIAFSSQERHEYYFSFLCDGMILFFWILVKSAFYIH